MVNILTPLSTQVPIVEWYDKEGKKNSATPTPYFARLLQEISEARISASVIDALGGDPDANAVVVWDDALGDLAFLSISEFIDWISGADEHGAILFRGATEWEALAPGNDGDVLTTHDTGNDPTWETPSSGGGYGFFREPTPPVVADYTWQNQGTASAADAANGRGIIVTVPSATTNVRLLRKTTLSPPSTPYRICARFAPMMTRASGSLFKLGLMVRDSGNGRIMCWSSYNHNELTRTRHTSDSGIESTPFSQANPYLELVPYKGIHNDGTTLSFQISPDGDNWLTMNTCDLTDLTDTGTGLDQAGFGAITASPGFEEKMLVQDFWIDDL